MMTTVSEWWLSKLNIANRRDVTKQSTDMIVGSWQLVHDDQESYGYNQ